MYRFIDYRKIFEDAEAMPAQTPPAQAQPKEVKEIKVDITEAKIAELQAAVEKVSVFGIDAESVLYTDGSQSAGMVYIAIKPAGGQQSEQNLQQIEALKQEAASGKPVVMYEADANKLSSILELEGDPEGALTSVLFDANPERTKQVKITFRKADAPAQADANISPETQAPQEEPAMTNAEIAAETGLMTGANPMEAQKAIMSFDSFVSEAKKEKWIGDIEMKKGALRKEMKKDKGEKIKPEDIAKSEAKLKKKDKDKKKPGLQLDKKDAKTHKRNVLAKNLMKASGAMNESRQMKIKGAKDQLVKIHEVIEKMIKQTSRKNEKK
jgi:hypothetical protein